MSAPVERDRHTTLLTRFDELKISDMEEGDKKVPPPIPSYPAWMVRFSGSKTIRFPLQ